MKTLLPIPAGRAIAQRPYRVRFSVWRDRRPAELTYTAPARGVRRDALGSPGNAVAPGPRSSSSIAGGVSDRPNVILINCDDIGYGDLGCYGSEVHDTPALDRMAAEGARLTDFYMASPVCSPSRGSMLTGCYPRRIGFDDFDGIHVLFPGMGVGLNPSEVTIARLLKDVGYSTMMVGKWHCGDQPEFLPTRHGFDHWLGLPYSNDMGIQPDALTAEERAEIEENMGIKLPPPLQVPLPLMLDEAVIEAQPDQAALTTRYLQESIRFKSQFPSGDGVKSMDAASLEIAVLTQQRNPLRTVMIREFVVAHAL